MEEVLLNGGEQVVGKWTGLKVARARAGLTQFDLALRVGLSESRIARLETLRQRPTPRELAQLAEALGIDAEELGRDTT